MWRSIGAIKIPAGWRGQSEEACQRVVGRTPAAGHDFLKERVPGPPGTCRDVVALASR